MRLKKASKSFVKLRSLAKACFILEDLSNLQNEELLTHNFNEKRLCPKIKNLYLRTKTTAHKKVNFAKIEPKDLSWREAKNNLQKRTRNIIFDSYSWSLQDLLMLSFKLRDGEYYVLIILACRLDRQDSRRRLPSLHGPRTDRPSAGQGLRHQVRRLVVGHHPDRGLHRKVSISEMELCIRAATTGTTLNIFFRILRINEFWYYCHFMFSVFLSSHLLYC